MTPSAINPIIMWTLLAVSVLVVNLVGALISRINTHHGVRKQAVRIPVNDKQRHLPPDSF